MRRTFFCGAVFEWDIDIAFLAHGQVVLADLVIFRQVGVIIAFAVPFCKARDFEVQCQGCQDGVFVRFFVHDGQAAGHSQADRAYIGVGRVAVAKFTAAEHFGLGGQLNVYFQTYY